MTSATLFRTARPVGGFANGVGYDNAQAATALGSNGQIDVAADNGALVWRVIGGDGWKTGEPITFYWQSTLAARPCNRRLPGRNGRQHGDRQRPLPREGKRGRCARLNRRAALTSSSR